MTRRNLRLIALCLWLGTSVMVVQTGYSSGAQTLSREDAKKLKSPVPYTKSSIARGRVLYTHDCTGCHGNDGKAQVDVIADATDLTDPKLWKSGTTEGEILRSIRDGAGMSMPPFKSQIREEKDLWHLVNFIYSLWPESQRPKLQEGK